jgi:hypothetical protein
VCPPEFIGDWGLLKEIRSMNHESPAVDDVRNVVKRINAAWTQGNLNDLTDCFDQRIVMVHPGLEARTTGREACIRSYKEFLEQATVREYHEDEPTIDVWKNVAIASYRFYMDYDIGGTRARESGFDIYVFTRAVADEVNPWRAIWRTMIASESQTD